MALAAVTAVSPTTGPAMGGTSFSLTGTGLAHCFAYAYFRTPDLIQRSVSMTVDSDTAGHGATPSFLDGSYAGQKCDVGVYDNQAHVYVWLPAAFTISAVPAGYWDRHHWDAANWGQRSFSPGAGWRYDWQVWYQSQTTVVWDMTQSVVEARWSTDSHTAGDGTYRGDIQPGTLQLQIHDPQHLAETMDKTGTIWLRYIPQGYCWGFYVDTVTRQLVAPGDPTAADCVITGTPWPVYLTTDCTLNFSRPAERVDARLTAIAANLSQDSNRRLPTYHTNIATDYHTAQPIPTPTSLPGNAYPAALTMIRDAAANGVAWVSAGANANGVGEFTLNYARWETYTGRNLYQSDIVAGIPFDQSMADLVTQTEFDALDAAGVASSLLASSSRWLNYGMQKITMRLLGDLSSVGTPDFGPAQSTAVNLLLAREDPTRSRLSAVSATSGLRTTPAGGSGPVWVPSAHVWSPVEVLDWVPPAGQSTWQYQYWVTKTAHRLTARVWESAHTLELWARAVALPT